MRIHVVAYPSLGKGSPKRHEYTGWSVILRTLSPVKTEREVCVESLRKATAPVYYSAFSQQADDA